MNTESKIYVADLAAYNAGHLHGIWIDACKDVEDIQDEINEMLSQSPVQDAEEYAIHDVEGFGSYQLHEYDGIDRAHEIAEFIEEYPEYGGLLLSHFWGDLEEAKSAAENYNGCYKSLADYAQEITEETTNIPENLKFYIDYDRLGADMETSGDIFTIETGIEEVHIFWSR